MATRLPPQITKFTISPQEFTPNQDSISDRVTINVGLNKPATLLVTLQNELCHGLETPPADNPTLVCAPFPLHEKEGAARKSGEAGLHEYDYDAGVDLGADPPPDGTYVVTARVEDAIGQAVTLTDTLTIKDGGIPRAEIVDGTVNFSRSSLLVGDTLYFTLTVENYGAVPIRTSGPDPVTCTTSIRITTSPALPKNRVRGAWASTSTRASASIPSAGRWAARAI